MRPSFIAAGLAAFSLASVTSVSASAQSIAERLAAADRSAEDMEIDAARRPVEVLETLGLEEGMTALAVSAAHGWYAEVLSIAVGPNGTVHAQNPPGMNTRRGAALIERLQARLEGDRLPNVEYHEALLPETGITPGSVDLAISPTGFHQVYHLHNEGAAVGQLQAVFDLLKPGGVYGLIDHVGVDGQDNKALKRIQTALVVDFAERAGFEVEQSDLFANPDDDHTVNSADPSIMGSTDRFFLILRKPA